MNRRETERLLTAIRDVQRQGRRAAIATVVRVRGSAYRREGARILVREDGTYECLLSGGCLEPAVADAAARVIATGTPVIAQYDLEADSIWSLAIGCSGAVDILIERVDDDPVTRAWLDVLDRAEAAVLVKPLNGVEGRLLVRQHEVLGTLGHTLEERAIASARERLRAASPVSGSEPFAQAELFFEVSMPPPELTIFGAGFDAEPLSHQAWALGFDITVVDVREAFLNPGRFPQARLVCAHGDRLAHAASLGARSFVVVMNHHLERDRDCLRFALRSPAAYIGVLGPRSRFDKLRARLVAEGEVLDAAAWARVRSPVGLAIGAETPEEIAVSILAEIVAIQRGFDGGFLTGRAASLHVPSATSAFARS
jgi:xanthine dehydrogenase accessory factor